MFSNRSNVLRFVVGLVVMASLSAGCHNHDDHHWRPRPIPHRHAAALPDRIVTPEPALSVEPESRATA